MTWRVFLAGEGPSEIGNADAPAQYSSEAREGVLHALLCRTIGSGFHIVGARKWKDIRKLQIRSTRTSGTNEADTVEKICVHAIEANANLIVFVRDRDGQPGREADITAGLAAARIKFASELARCHLVGGVATEAVEAWVLAIQGDTRCERHRDPKGLIRAGQMNHVDYLVSEIAKPARINPPPAAKSLHAFLQQLRGAAEAGPPSR